MVLSKRERESIKLASPPLSTSLSSFLSFLFHSLFTFFLSISTPLLLSSPQETLPQPHTDTPAYNLSSLTHSLYFPFLSFFSFPSLYHSLQLHFFPLTYKTDKKILTKTKTDKNTHSKTSPKTFSSRLSPVIHSTLLRFPTTTITSPYQKLTRGKLVTKTNKQRPPPNLPHPHHSSNSITYNYLTSVSASSPTIFLVSLQRITPGYTCLQLFWPIRVYGLVLKVLLLGVYCIFLPQSAYLPAVVLSPWFTCAFLCLSIKK